MFFLLLLISTLQRNWGKGQNRFCLEGRAGRGREQGQEGKMIQTMYAHVTKLIKKRVESMASEGNIVLCKERKIKM
jgi:hypothetical protein